MKKIIEITQVRKYVTRITINLDDERDIKDQLDYLVYGIDISDEKNHIRDFTAYKIIK